jgi:hypothetical protein
MVADDAAREFKIFEISKLTNRRSFYFVTLVLIATVPYAVS